MTLERTGLIKFRGEDQTVVGADLQVGDAAPDFMVIDNDWNPIHPLELAKGKVAILTALPSLETAVCDRETRRFNEEATNASEDIRIFAISTDLPFTQSRWCGGADIDRVQTASDHLETDFGRQYGVLIKEKRILRRAVFVVDRQGKLVYVAYLPTLGDEPDYEAVLAAARTAL